VLSDTTPRYPTHRRTRTNRIARFFDEGPVLMGSTSWIAAGAVTSILIASTIFAAVLAARQGAAFDTACVPFQGSLVCKAPTAPVGWFQFISASSAVLVIVSLLCVFPRLPFILMRVERPYQFKIAARIVGYRYRHVWPITCAVVLMAVMTYTNI